MGEPMMTMLSVKEVARQKGCTVTYIYALLAADRMPKARKVGKVWQIPAKAVLRPVQNGSDSASARVGARA